VSTREDGTDGRSDDRDPDDRRSDDGMSDDHVFKALADPTRRLLLDRLFTRDGRTLTELESELEMTRFGVMKHLRVLEGAGLVVTRRSGREKLHFLNPVPIRLIHDRWIDKYTEGRVSALADLKAELEDDTA
jgi:DNA-binding transcriptional ArsR family regulator